MDKAGEGTDVQVEVFAVVDKKVGLKLQMVKGQDVFVLNHKPLITFTHS
jgi:hypothetical protein